MTDRQYVSVSELSTARSCRHKWWLHYNERLTPVQVQSHFRHGSAVHAGTEAVYLHIKTNQESGYIVLAGDLHASGQDAVERYFDDLGQIEGFDRVPAENDAQDSVARLIDNIALRDAEECEVVTVESKGRVPLLDVKGSDRSRLDFKYLVDVLLRDRETSELIVVDHKTTTGDTSQFDSRFEVDPQMPGYVYAAAVEHNGTKLTGMGRARFNVIKKTGPKEPRVLKDGTIGVSSSDTTRGIYAAAHKRALLGSQPELSKLVVDLEHVEGDDKKADNRRKFLQKEIGKFDRFNLSTKQKELMAKLPTGLSKWVTTHEYRYSAEEIERWRQEAWDDARMIRDMRAGRLSHSRNGAICGPSYTMDCHDKQICCSDSPEIRQALYTVRQRD